MCARQWHLKEVSDSIPSHSLASDPFLCQRTGCRLLSFILSCCIVHVTSLFTMTGIVPTSGITKREELQFARLMRSAEFEELMQWDQHFEIADNYLISVALIYLLRARYTFQQFTFFNLMVALYLAHEVEEEDWINCRMRPDLIRSAFGSHSISEETYRLFMKKKERLWKALQYNVIVKREESDAVMFRLMRESHVWLRMRSSRLMYPLRQRFPRLSIASDQSDTDLSSVSG